MDDSNISRFESADRARMLRAVNEKWPQWLPFVFLGLFACSRWPGLFPPSFSAAYALMFCAGAFFTGRKALWIPLGTLLLTDIALNLYYMRQGWDVWTAQRLGYQAFVYVAYVLIFLFGRRFNNRSSALSLVGGGILGALIFYVVTNTVSWLMNPFQNREYTLDLAGWLLAILKGTGGWPDAWLFFRNSLLSGGLFTALFVAVTRLTAPAESPDEKQAGVRTEDQPEGEEPEEAKA
jgi:hypothetical protein